MNLTLNTYLQIEKNKEEEKKKRFILKNEMAFVKILK